MAKLRKPDSGDPLLRDGHRPRNLRIVASGTLFLTHTITLPTHPAEASVVRARAVQRQRGGSAANILATLGQFAGVDAMLVAPLAGNDEGVMLTRELERANVNTRFCKVWEGANVPSAWVLESEDTNAKTVINHNPLPDITHEEFVGLLGPLLVPENYAFTEHAIPSPQSPLPNNSGQQLRDQIQIQNQSVSPFEWLHFEGRSVKTTLSNIVGIDGLARERKWRSHCVFSLDACKVRQGIEALMPHADVIFFSKQYALSQSTSYSTPRPFLLALAASGRVPQHALLVAYWGSAGAALLSVPTREYLQSSGWVSDEAPNHRPLSTVSTDTSGNVLAGVNGSGAGQQQVESVRSGSGFWAAGHRSGSGTSSSAFTAFSSGMSHSHGYSNGHGDSDAMDDTLHAHLRAADATMDDDDHDSQGTEVRRPHQLDSGDSKDKPKEEKQELAAQDAFVAGMIYALGQRLLPGAPYTPSAASYKYGIEYGGELDRGRWKLEDCLRFASELAGRRARRRDFAGLAEEMMHAGWFD